VTRRGPVIAVDGPSGSGKSTLARRLAEELDLPYLNTGLMYRALALRALRAGVDPDDGARLAALAGTLTFDLNTSVRPARLAIDGADPDAALQSADVESTVSVVSRHPGVRAALIAEQRRLCKHGGVVEGRDIGTVVAPDATAKLYLRADESERIARRTTERGGDDARTIGPALAARDTLDAHVNRPEPAEDAVAIDTTQMGADDVFRTALAVVRARIAERGR
jgi:cytidylate kinase